MAQLNREKVATKTTNGTNAGDREFVWGIVGKEVRAM